MYKFLYMPTDFDLKTCAATWHDARFGRRHEQTPDQRGLATRVSESVRLAASARCGPMCWSALPVLQREDPDD
jgi:hypothetical protein